jgi:hypothetical protein
MKMVRFDDRVMQGNRGASLGMPPGCVCGAGSSDPSHPSSQGPEAICPDCGGSLPQVAAPKQQERKQLQDFLSAFV